MAELAALINVNSTHYNRRIMRLISEAVQHLDGQDHCFPTWNKESILRGVRKAAELRPKRLLICSGDGGLLGFFGGLKQHYQDDPFPKIVYVPTGRENRLGYELGLQRNPYKLLEELIGEIVSGSERYEELSLIKANLDQKRELLTFDLGFGLSTNLLVKYYRTDPKEIKESDDFRNMAHDVRYGDGFKTLGEAIFYSVIYGQEYLSKKSKGIREKLGLEKLTERFRPAVEGLDRERMIEKINYWNLKAKGYFGEIKAKITLDGQKEVENEWSAAFIATNQTVWKKFRPMYQGRKDPAKMHLLATSLPPLIIVTKIKTLYKGGPLQNGSNLFGETVDELAARININFEQEEIIQMAGEFYIAKNVGMEVDRTISFLQPK